MARWAPVAISGIAAVAMAACGSSGGPSSSASAGLPASAQTIGVTSDDLASGAFPKDLTCDGANRPPTLSLSDVPAGTRSLALEMVDPDAPSGSFTHWLAYADGAPTGPAFPPAGSHAGRNDAGGTGYTGPCPPAGQLHHYHVLVFALSFALGPGGAGLTDGFTRKQLDDAISSNRGTVLGRGELVATYRRG